MYATIETKEVIVEEEVLLFRDKWDSTYEQHYTEEWLKILTNSYIIDVIVDKEGNILDTLEEIKKKVYTLAVGVVLNYKVIN